MVQRDTGVNTAVPCPIAAKKELPTGFGMLEFSTGALSAMAPCTDIAGQGAMGINATTTYPPFKSMPLLQEPCVPDDTPTSNQKTCGEAKGQEFRLSNSALHFEHQGVLPPEFPLGSRPHVLSFSLELILKMDL